LSTADTNAYAAGDAIGIDAAGSPGSAVLNLGLVVTNRGVIDRASLRINRATIPVGMDKHRLHLYVGAPTAILDNAAWDLVAADRALYCGFIEFAVPEIMGVSTLWAQVKGLDFRFGLGGALYGILTTMAGYTAASGDIYTIGLHGADC
jgi:hypothetical protein